MDINILWYKKDLRLLDHLPLKLASEGDFVPIYIFEPSVSYNYDFDLRHWQFIYQSLLDLKSQGLEVQIFYAEAIEVFTFLSSQYAQLKVFSHQETGNQLTFERDLLLKDHFEMKGIYWSESQNNMVIRGLKNRDTWDARWIKEAKKEIVTQVNISNQKHLSSHPFTLPKELENNLNEKNSHRAIGGETKALKQLEEFLTVKIEDYWGSLSYPEKSRYYCSLLSAFLSYGNISIRQIYQACDKLRLSVQNKKSLEQFQARLKWHCHFIQKLEMEPRIEFENLNCVFNQIRQKKNKKLLKAWMNGQTGYPLIDAAMRCVKETGYLNFRLRATVVSFLTHLLWQPWQAGSGHLARMFLDYEPGIHFSQFQMQAGTTGINTIRIYNPIKQSKEKDKEGVFIKRWVPELRSLPTKFLHEPWLLTSMDEIMYDFKLGEDYPKPIVEFNLAYKRAQDKLWQIKKSEANKAVSPKILRKHASRGRRRD